MHNACIPLEHQAQVQGAQPRAQVRILVVERVVLVEQTVAAFPLQARQGIPAQQEAAAREHLHILRVRAGPTLQGVRQSAASAAAGPGG